MSAKVSSRCASMLGNPEAGTTKTSSPPRTGVSADRAGEAGRTRSSTSVTLSKTPAERRHMFIDAPPWTPAPPAGTISPVMGPQGARSMPGVRGRIAGERAETRLNARWRMRHAVAAPTRCRRAPAVSAPGPREHAPFRDCARGTPLAAEDGGAGEPARVESRSRYDPPPTARARLTRSRGQPRCHAGDDARAHGLARAGRVTPT